MSAYTIRWCQPDDVEAFLDLYVDVFDRWQPSRAWFDWKYSANPYTDELPIIVAENDGDLVGARPFFALPMAVAGTEQLALQPADTMVHPEHRGEGLFTRMTERAIDYYTEREPAFFFNFPNDQSLPGYRKLGWETVGELTQYYRIGNPEAVLSDRSGAEAYRKAGQLAGPIVDAYNAIHDATADVQSVARVREQSGVPAEELAKLDDRSSPDSIQVVRDEAFLSWRYGNPQWEYSTYLVSDGGMSVGMIVGDAVGMKTELSVTHVIDVLPPSGFRSDTALLPLLGRMLADRPDTDIFVAPASLFPAPVIRSLGFVSDDRPPLRYVARGRTQAVRSLPDWQVGGMDIRDPDNWCVSFAELDTS